MNHGQWYRILLATIVVFIATYYFYYDSLFFLPGMQCIFYNTTGLYCMGCGGQRAFHALLHGNVVDAAQNNLLIFMVLPIAGIKLLEEFVHKKIFPDIFYSRRILFLLLLFCILFIVLRNIPFKPFYYLAPISF